MATAPGTTGKRPPRYQLLADTLRREINDDAYAERAFPTETALCERFGVSRFTVREALRTLQGERLIERKHGSGTTVQAPARRGSGVRVQFSSIAEILDYAVHTSFDFELAGESRLPQRLADHAGLPNDESWVRFAGLRWSAEDPLPIAWTDGFIHADLREASTRLEQRDMALFRQLEILAGVKFVTVLQDIQAVAATRKLAATLAVKPRSPCLRVLRCYIDDRDKMLVISESWHPGARFASAMHFHL